jgi:putative radical SAM enzyme (TIGR03279 family)
MQAEQGYLIESVVPGSPAAAAGIVPGERLLRMDNRPVRDIIDYQINEADHTVGLLLLAPQGRLRRVRVEKPAGSPLGLRFNPPTMAPLHRCGNRCLFCFVDQNPPGLRPSLYLKDDDYRLSFLFGNFITLNNLRPGDLTRIIKLQLSPLYISVHAADPALRRLLFGSARAGRGLENLRRLVRGGIRVHLQIVLCPGLNTGAALRDTVKELARLGRGAASIALVPVGLTAHRPEAGVALRRFEAAEARALVEEASRWQRFFLAARGSRLVFLADEFYRLAGRPYPPAEAYEGFPQLENGVGLARLFLDELDRLGDPPLEKLPRPVKVTLATGKEAAPLLEEAVRRLRAAGNLFPALAVVENRFFGSPVTVAGLLTASDLEAGLKDCDLGEALFISRSLLKEGSGLFLDGGTTAQLERSLKVRLRAVSGPRELVEAVRKLSLAPAPGFKEELIK